MCRIITVADQKGFDQSQALSDTTPLYRIVVTPSRNNGLIYLLFQFIQREVLGLIDTITLNLHQFRTQVQHFLLTGKA